MKNETIGKDIGGSIPSGSTWLNAKDAYHLNICSDDNGGDPSTHLTNVQVLWGMEEFQTQSRRPTVEEMPYLHEIAHNEAASSLGLLETLVRCPTTALSYICNSLFMNMSHPLGRVLRW